MMNSKEMPKSGCKHRIISLIKIGVVLVLLIPFLIAFAFPFLRLYCSLQGAWASGKEYSVELMRTNKGGPLSDQQKELVTKRIKEVFKNNGYYSSGEQENLVINLSSTGTGTFSLNVGMPVKARWSIIYQGFVGK
ncbi:MAG: hypothetical protein HQM08_19185 [Candidatus Riflebacteria bacterium]|nr:hypothetical protein [Candidatus Riflebacteria bacterium]